MDDMQGHAVLLALILLITPLLMMSSQIAVFGDTGGQLKGNNIDLTISPFPIDVSKSNNVTLSFTPHADQKAFLGSSITPNKIDHLDYLVIISQNGKEVFNKQMHTHSGNLILEFTGGSVSVGVIGGQSDPNNTTTGPYYVSGPVFTGSGNYEISASVVGIEFNPLPNPLGDKFTVQAVPEFGSMATIVLVTSIFGILVITSKARFGTL